MTVFRYYRIKSLIDNKSYIGKTTQTLKQRLQNHHRDLTAYLKKTRNSSNRGSFKIIKDKLEGIDYAIELIFELDVEQEPTERVIEQIFINNEKTTNPDGCCNINDAFISIDQTKQRKNEKAKKYYQDHQEELKEQHKEYNQDHQDEIKEKANKKVTCPICGGKYTHQNKSNHCNTIKHQEAIYNQDQVK